MEEIERTFRAMNTDVLVIVAVEAGRRVEAEVALYGVEKLFADVERVASRFRPESELSCLNRSDGQPFGVSATLFALVSRALEAARATDGLFDPTVLGALRKAGYDRSYELLGEERASDAYVQARESGGWRDMRLDKERLTVFLPKGCGLDLGGVGKGWTVDLAADRLGQFDHFAIDAGGDIVTRGVQANGQHWSVGVADPLLPQRDVLALSLRDRAVATSTSSVRRWWVNGQEKNHLIDPRTGEPTRSGVASATVVADSVAWADVLAKVALLLGPERGARFLEARRGVEGLLLLADGGMWCSKGLDEVRNVA